MIENFHPTLDLARHISGRVAGHGKEYTRGPVIFININQTLFFIYMTINYMYIFIGNYFLTKCFDPLVNIIITKCKYNIIGKYKATNANHRF